MPGDAGWTGRSVINYTLEICAQCRLPFAADSTKPWLRKCTPCWKLGKGYVLGKADRDQQFLARQLDDMARRCAPAPAPALSRDVVTTLITLCHPDKHQNSAVATRATAMLLDLRSVVNGR